MKDSMELFLSTFFRKPSKIREAIVVFKNNIPEKQKRPQDEISWRFRMYGLKRLKKRVVGINITLLSKSECRKQRKLEGIKWQLFCNKIESHTSK